MRIRTRKSSANALKRALNPAGRSSSSIPSGVSAATTVSSTSCAIRRSGPDDDRVGDQVMNGLAPRAEDEQHIDDAVQRDHLEQAIDDVAQPKYSTERRF